MWGLHMHGRTMERLAFRYDRYEEITRYIQMRHMYYHPMVIHVFCLALKVFGWFCYSRCHKVILIMLMFHKICILISLP